MRLALVAQIVILSVTCCNSAWSQGRISPKGAFSSHRVAGNVYMLDKGTSDSDGGANLAVLVGSDGLVLVDAKGEPWHQMVLVVLRQLSGKPVRYVIDTHCHGDHTWGNAAFQREGAVIIAHRNVRAMLAGSSDCGPPGTGVPTVTLDDRLTLYIDDEEVQIVKLPAGHTDGDVMVYFKKANVLETGDAFIGAGFISSSLPGPSTSDGGNMLGVVEALKMMLELIPADAKVIPGHGAQAAMDDVRRSLRILEGMRDAIQHQIQSGMTLEEILKTDVLSPWKDSYGPACVPHQPCDHLDAQYLVRNFYASLTAQSR
jgi:cyclase